MGYILKAGEVNSALPCGIRYVATCGVTQICRHSRKKSGASNPLSPPTVTTPASRNFPQHFQRGMALGRPRGFPHWLRTIQLLRFSTSRFQLGLLARVFARQVRF